MYKIFSLLQDLQCRVHNIMIEKTVTSSFSVSYTETKGINSEA